MAGLTDKCEKCLNSRPIVSENGIHHACCLSSKAALYCQLTSVHFAPHPMKKEETMREMDAFEQAYKNGYAAGMKTAEEKIVHCKDCQYFEEAKVNELGFLICRASGMEITENDFCSYGERRSDG